MPTPIPADRQLYRGRFTRTMLLILLFLSLVPLLVMAGTAYSQMRSLLRSQVSSHISTVLDVQAQSISSEVQNSQHFLEHLLDNSTLRDLLDIILAEQSLGSPAPARQYQSVRSYLLSAISAQPYFDTFLIVSSDRTIKASTNPDWEGLAFPVELLAGNPAATTPGAAAASRLVYALDPFFPDSLGIISAIPYYNRQGQPLGWVIGISGPSRVADLASAASFYSTGSYFITARGEYIQAGAGGELALRTPDVPFRQAVSAGLESPGRRGVQEMTSIDGKPVVAAYTWLPALQSGWLIQVEQDQAYAGLDRLAQTAILLLLATAALVAVVFSYFSRRMSGPLRELALAMQRFAGGAWDQRIPSNRRDELGLLASSFNSLAGQVSGQIHSLQTTLAGRTQQAICTAQVTQLILSAPSLEVFWARLLPLLADRFSCSFAGVYLPEQGPGVADSKLVLHAAAGPETAHRPGLRIGPGSPAPVWSAFQDRQSRCHRFAPADPRRDGREDLAPGACGEAAVPLLAGDQALGVIHIQTAHPEGFNPVEFTDFQALVDLVAPAVDQFQRTGGAPLGLAEGDLLFEASHQIAQARTSRQILQVAVKALARTSYASAILVVTPSGIDLVSTHDPRGGGGATTSALPRRLPLAAGEIDRAFAAAAPLVISPAGNPPGIRSESSVPQPLVDLRAELGCQSLALLPVIQAGKVAAVLALGTPDETAAGESFTSAALQPYRNLADLAGASLEKLRLIEESRQRIAALQTLNTINQAISLETGLEGLYQVIHQQITDLMGDLSFLIALYEPDAGQIHIPYFWEEGQLVHVPPFPLGEGLTSILIRTGQPLLLGFDAEERLIQLGAKIIGQPPKSWLGVPLLVSGRPIGAIIIQDTQREGRFSEQDLRLMTTLAGQIALGIHNIRLLEAARSRAEREQVVSRMIASTHGSQDLENLLRTALKEIGRLPQVAEASVHLGPPSRKNPAGSMPRPENGRDQPPDGRLIPAPGNGRGTVSRTQQPDEGLTS